MQVLVFTAGLFKNLLEDGSIRLAEHVRYRQGT
jgi:hypothetical protein